MKTEKGFTELLKLQARDDDVIICGYPKSGANWMMEVVSMLLTGSAEYMKINKPSTVWFENTRDLEDGDLSRYDKLASPRILCSHLPYAMLPPDFLKKRTKLLFLCRNPKDAAVSLYNHLTKQPLLHYNGSWGAYLDLFIDGRVPYGYVLDDLARWHADMDAHPEMPILIVYYEDTKQDFMKQARRLCGFLGVSRDDEFLSLVYIASSFEKMKSNAQERLATDPNAPRGFKTLMRKGEVGDWKNWFTVAQSEMFDEYYRIKMKELSYEFKYVL